MLHHQVFLISFPCERKEKLASPFCVIILDLFYACWLTKNGSKQFFFVFFLFCWEKHCPMRAGCGMPGCVTTYDCLPSCARAKGSVCSSAPLPWEQTMGVLLPLWKPTMDCTWAGWISEVPKGISCLSRKPVIWLNYDLSSKERSLTAVWLLKLVSSVEISSGDQGLSLLLCCHRPRVILKCDKADGKDLLDQLLDKFVPCHHRLEQIASMSVCVWEVGVCVLSFYRKWKVESPKVWGFYFAKNSGRQVTTHYCPSC